MEVNADLPGFQGFYGSDYADQIHSVIEMYSEDSEQEYEVNYKEAYKEVCEALVEELQEEIKSSAFSEVIKSVKFVELHSPREYNFRNDKIECVFDIELDKFKDLLWKYEEEVKNHVDAVTAPRDGFTPFSSYTYGHGDFIEDCTDFVKASVLLEVFFYDILDLTSEEMTETVIDKLSAQGWPSPEPIEEQE